jgi:hypothetical protein
MTMPLRSFRIGSARSIALKATIVLSLSLATVANSHASFIETTWRASLGASVSCTGPTDASGHQWFAPAFDDSTWYSVTLPYSSLYGIANENDFYRGQFTIEGNPTMVWLSFSSDPMETRSTSTINTSGRLAPARVPALDVSISQRRVVPTSVFLQLP